MKIPLAFNNWHSIKLYRIAGCIALPFTLLVAPLGLKAQTNPVADAFMITRMANKFHVMPKPVDNHFSEYVFNDLFKELDGDKIIFTKGDLQQLEPFRFELDEEVKLKKTIFLSKLTGLYQQRLSQMDSMIENICKKPFNFTIAEKFTAAEDTSTAADMAALGNKLYKHLKSETLDELLDELDLYPGKATDKKWTDSMEVVLRSKTQKIFSRYNNRITESPGGVNAFVGNAYCGGIASYYDPHTEYFPLTEKENFESSVGSTPFRFGFSLKVDDEDGVVINGLKPGSPAFKSGLLNEDDKILSVKWENKQNIELSGATKGEVTDILNASNHDKATFTVKKADGSLREVVLAKEKDTDEADDKVRSFILKGEKNIGYISLPAFYTTWENESKEEEGCANDVAKEILKLKQEKIEGLMLDLRYNGGGSMQEAIELAGIFIDAGPVGQVKEKDEKVMTLKDVNRGTIYDGPLVLLVNGYSASASEMLAGTLQDYNRAIIAGSDTYGKATAQVVLPMDTTIDINGDADDVLSKKTDSYLKVTISQLYRVNGTTAQFTGVVPDVMIPDALEAIAERESNNATALVLPVIPANKYYKPYAPIPKAPLQEIAAKDIAGNNFFKELQDYKKEYKEALPAKDISLKLSDRLKTPEEEKATPPALAENNTANYIIVNTAYEQQRMKTDETLAESVKAMREYFQKDPYLQIAYDVLIKMKPAF